MHEPRASATWVSAVGGDADPVALGVGEDPETSARDMLSRLNDGAAQAFCLRKRLGHVLDGDEEQHLVVGALPRANRDVGAVLGACVYEGLTVGRRLRTPPSSRTGRRRTDASCPGRRSESRRGRRGGSWQVSSSRYGSEAGVGLTGRGAPLPVRRTQRHQIDTACKDPDQFSIDHGSRNGGAKKAARRSRSPATRTPPTGSQATSTKPWPWPSTSASAPAAVPKTFGLADSTAARSWKG